MCSAQRLGLALSDGARRMSDDSRAVASAVMSQFLSMDSIISELLWIVVLEHNCRRKSKSTAEAFLLE